MTEDPTLTAELSSIYTNIQKVLDLRHKYMRVSLQGPSDNPKDDPSWRIYPPPPPPVWVDDSQNLEGGPATHDKDDPQKSFWAGSEKHKEPSRKPGYDVGEDFVYDECDIPDEDEMEYKLDNQGVFQVYENKIGVFRAFVFHVQSSNFCSSGKGSSHPSRPYHPRILHGS